MYIANCKGFFDTVPKFHKLQRSWDWKVAFFSRPHEENELHADHKNMRINQYRLSLSCDLPSLFHSNCGINTNLERVVIWVIIWRPLTWLWPCFRSAINPGTTVAFPCYPSVRILLGTFWQCQAPLYQVCNANEDVKFWKMSALYSCERTSND